MRVALDLFYVQRIELIYEKLLLYCNGGFWSTKPKEFEYRLRELTNIGTIMKQ